jgi:menaquinone-dependent protoporphyrinogen oxidase
MTRILVAYATMAGSTAEVARAVGEEIGKSGAQVDVLPLEEVKDLRRMRVVVGGGMAAPWRPILRKHRNS